MKFPALPHLGLAATDVDFRHARGLDMYRHVSGKTWAYEPDVLATLLCLLAEHGKARFVNIGANMGYFPLIVAKVFGDRVDVHAYEPMPELLDRLDDARRRNGVEFHVSGVALADFEGTAPFHLSAKSDTSNSLNPDFRPSKDVIDVTVSTVDHEFPAGGRLLRRDRVPPGATVLLIDTESTEPAVLRGGVEFIRRVRPAIICEVLAGRTETDLAAFMADVDYLPYALTDRGPERRAEIVGDRSYQHRDWVFLPNGTEPPDAACFETTMRALGVTS